jgi:hypothetical protein
MKTLFPKLLFALIICLSSHHALTAQERLERSRNAQLDFPPELPGGVRIVTDQSEKFLIPADSLRPDVTVAKTPPTIDFLYYPGQTYKGKIWSNWGDSLAVNGKYYASIGDHDAPYGNAFVYEYDPATKTFRKLADLKKTLDLPEGHYVPGKIHGRLDMGKDGWIYFSTHRGSKRVTTDEYHYEGDWILRTNPKTAETEVVTLSPIPRHSIPNSVLDPEKMIFYGATASGINAEKEEIRFFAYDIENRKLLTSVTDGPARYMIFSSSQNTIYYTPNNDLSPLMKYDPAQHSEPQEIQGEIGIRSATQETKDGLIYSVSHVRGEDSMLYSLDVKSGKIRKHGPVPVGTQTYVATIDAGPNGRYLYYTPGAHGGSDKDGTPIVQYDTKTNKRKVLAFLDPFYRDKYRAIVAGTYSMAVDPAGDKLYVTWNVSRGSRAWDCCALTVIHIPESERPE